MGLFGQSLDELLQHPMDYKEHWVASVKAAIAQKQKHKHGAYLSKQ